MGQRGGSKRIRRGKGKKGKGRERMMGDQKTLSLLPPPFPSLPFMAMSGMCGKHTQRREKTKRSIQPNSAVAKAVVRISAHMPNLWALAAWALRQPDRMRTTNSAAVLTMLGIYHRNTTPPHNHYNLSTGTTTTAANRIQYLPRGT